MPGGSYVLLVAEVNTDAQGFYARHGLVVERFVDGPSHYGDVMELDSARLRRRRAGLIMRFTKAR